MTGSPLEHQQTIDFEKSTTPRTREGKKENYNHKGIDEHKQLALIKKPRVKGEPEENKPQVN
jgi:hypothetical protein